MASRDTIQARLDVVAHAHLGELQKALGSQGLSRRVDQVDILSAAVLYTSPPQLAGMLREYWRSTDERLREAEGSEKQ